MKLHGLRYKHYLGKVYSYHMLRLYCIGAIILSITSTHNLHALFLETSQMLLSRLLDVMNNIEIQFAFVAIGGIAVLMSFVLCITI